MQREDRTGPLEKGRMTGRGAGYRDQSESPRYGRGFRDRGFGGGRGWRNIFFATGLPRWMRIGGHAAPRLDPEMEAQELRSQAQFLRGRLDMIEKRLAEIKTGTAKQQT